MIWELYALAGILGALIGALSHSIWVNKYYLSIHVSRIDKQCLQGYIKGLGGFALHYIPHTPKPKAKLKLIKGETDGKI